MLNGRLKSQALQALEVACRIVIVNVTILDLLGQLALALPGLLGVLQLQPVLVHWVAHGLDALVVQGQASPDAVVERLARLASGVDVSRLLRLHKALLVVDRGLDDTVADSLCNNVLCRLFALQTKANADVTERDARVRERQHANARLDDVLSQTQNQCVGLVLVEDLGICLNDLEEALQITDTNRLHQTEVWLQSTLQAGLAEDVTFGNVTHEQLDDDQKLHGGLVEASRNIAGGRLAGGANEVVVCLGVGELDSAYATEVVEVSGHLVVRGVGRELRLRDEEIGLCNVGGGDVVAEEEGGDGCLCVWILAEDCTSHCGEQLATDVDDGRLLGGGFGVELLVEEREVEVGFGAQRVERPPVHVADLVDELL